jgi:hypothetical protein
MNSRDKSHLLQENSKSLPLQQMTSDERLIADYSGTDLRIGKHQWNIGAQSCAGKGPGSSSPTGKQRMLWKAEREDFANVIRQRRLTMR